MILKMCSGTYVKLCKSGNMYFGVFSLEVNCFKNCSPAQKSHHVFFVLFHGV